MVNEDEQDIHAVRADVGGEAVAATDEGRHMDMIHAYHRLMVSLLHF